MARDLGAFVPALLFGVAAGIAAVDAAALHVGLLAPLPSMLPIDPDLSQPVTAAVAAVGLLALAIGLRRRKRVAWWLAIMVLTAALLVQVELLQHVLGAVLAAVCLGLLILVRRSFKVETGARSRRAALLLWGFGALLAVAGLATVVGSALRLVSPAIDAQDVGSALLSWLAFGDPGLAVRPHIHGGLLLAVTLAGRLAIAVGVIVALAPGEAPDRSVDAERRADSVAAQYGQGALLPFQLGPDTHRFGIDGVDALVAYGLDGRVAVILGDTIGPPRQARRLLVAFLRWSRQRDWVPAVYQASVAALAPLRALGFVAYRIGQEAILELESFDVSGSRRANLRHTVSRARRAGVTVTWYPDGLGNELPTRVTELDAVDRAWRAGGRPSMGFSVSRFLPADLVRNPIAIARDASGQAIAFVTFRSTGRDGGWVLDLMRRAPGGVPGAVETCLVDAALALRRAGAVSLSLGLAPLAGLTMASGSPIERGFGLAARLTRRVYDVSGLAFFKAKFDPRWEDRYLAVHHRRDIPLVGLALVRLHFGGARGLLRAGWQLRPAPGPTVR